MASVRVRDIIHWQECADTALYGYRPGRRAEDMWIDLSLPVEPALVDGSDLIGLSIDCSKCFDRVPRGIDFQLAERQGIHLRVLQPLRGMYRELRRRFVVASHVGKEFEASNGIIPGSLLKCAFNHFFHQHLGQIRESRDRRCNAKVYVDDAGVFSKDSGDIDVGLKTRVVLQRHAAETERRKNQSLELLNIFLDVVANHSEFSSGCPMMLRKTRSGRGITVSGRIRAFRRRPA